MKVTLFEENVQLLPEKALWLPDYDVLVVADTHFGKDASFRKGGLAVPRGSSDATLAKIDELVRRYRAARLVFLGDMFHARCSLTLEFTDQLDEFFVRHSDVKMHLTLGNHDVATDRFPVEWPLEICESLQLGNITLEHFPRDVTETQLLCCGHIHPAVKLDSLGRLPCFWLNRSQLVLPAIGEFTGTKVIAPSADDCVWISDGSAIHELAVSR